MDGMLVAELLALGADGKALVRVLAPDGLPPRLRQPIFAKYCAPLGKQDIGAEVAVLFEQGHPGRPLVIAAMHRPPAEPQPAGPSELRHVALQLDGKVILSGTYLVSRSSGVNRIKGGSVQIN